MDMILVSVTLISLAMTMTMTVVVWRLVREERRRTEVRIAALAASAVHPRRKPRESVSVPVEALIADLPLRPSSNESRPLFQEATEPPRRFSFVAAAFILAVIVLGSALLAVNQHGTATEGQTMTRTGASALELVALHHLREGERLSVQGRIRNPTNGAPLSHLSAVVFLFDRHGTYIASGRAPIELQTLQPGEESSFTVALPDAAAVSRYRVSFRSETGGVLRHVDRREMSTMATTGIGQ